MSEVAILLLTTLLLVAGLLVILLLICIGMLIWAHFAMRTLRHQVDEIFDTCVNTEEYMAIQAQNEGITAVQN